MVINGVHIMCVYVFVVVVILACCSAEIVYNK